MRFLPMLLALLTLGCTRTQPQCFEIGPGRVRQDAQGIVWPCEEPKR